MPTYTIKNTNGDVLLAGAMPEAEYMYGCTPTAFGMLLGYYDLYGYRGTALDNIIEGDVALKSRGTDGNAYDMDAFDIVLGKAIASEEYVYRFHSRNSVETTPAQELEYTFKEDGKTLNTDEWNCIADYIGTGQFWRGNSNLSTSVAYGSIEELYGYEFNEPISDGTTTMQVRYLYTTMLYGLDLYVQSRGYALDYEITGAYPVDVCGGDFTFEDYKAEIDAGRPMLISIEGHSMVGYGYNDATREIIFDDCYRADQRMVWGESYYYSGANRALQTITVVGINVGGNVDLAVVQTAGSSEKLIVSDAAGALTSSDYCFAGSPVHLTYTISNLGTDDSGAFHVAIRVDDELVSSTMVNTINTGDSRKFTDVSLGKLSVGQHNVRVVVDESNEIQEFSGLNNVAETDILVLKSGTSVLSSAKNLDDWKTVSDTFIYGGGTLHLTDAWALDTVLRGKITSSSANGMVWYLPGRANVSQGGYMSSTDVYSYGEVYVSNGGTAVDTHVFSEGLAYVDAGGIASGMTVGAYGELVVSSGGMVTGRVRLDANAYVSFSSGSILDFNLANAAPGDAACVNDISLIYGTPTFTITVSDMLDNGTYMLADGAAGFKQTVTMYDSDGYVVDSFKPGGSFYVGKAKYTLKLSGDTLTMTISGKTMPDTIAPIVTDVKPSTTTPTKYPVTVTAVFSDNRELATSLYRIGETGEWKHYSGGVTVEENATIYFKAVDAEGNESGIVSYAVTNIDRTAPDIPIVFADIMEPTKRRVKVFAEFGADVSLKEYSLDNVTWVKYSGAVKMPENGMVYFRGTDAAGNVSEVADYEVTNIDKSLPDDGPDNGWNDYLYNKRDGLNPNAEVFPETVLWDVFSGAIQMDEPGSVSVDGKSNFVGKYDEDYIDAVDYARIELATAAKLVFTIDSTDSVKFTVCKLNETIDKKGKVSYSVKTLQTNSFTRQKGKTSVNADTKGLLLEAGVYYLAVQSTNYKKGGAAFYNVTLNRTGDKPSCFYSDGDNGKNNYLYDKKQKDAWNANVRDAEALVIDSSCLEVGQRAIQIDTDTETVVEHEGFTNFVGFGDASDFRKIELKFAAKLSFDLAKTTGGAAKLVVYTVNDSGKMVVANSKLMVTTKATATSGILKNQVVLQKGVYYIAVQSTDASKGKEAYYNVSLNAKSVFYEDGDLGTNNFISKTKKVDEAVREDENAVSLYAGEQLRLDGVLDGDAEINETKGGVEYFNFVGTGDDSDIVRIQANAGMKVSLKVTATDAVSLVVYGLQNNGTLKALKTVKSKNNVAELIDFELKAKSAPGGQFFLGVTSTNAKKGSAAYYNVDVVSVSGQDLAPFSASEAFSLAMPEADSLGISDALNFGQYDADALADASASALAELDDKSGWLNITSLA